MSRQSLLFVRMEKKYGDGEEGRRSWKVLLSDQLLAGLFAQHNSRLFLDAQHQHTHT